MPMSVWETSGLNSLQKTAVEEIIEDCTFPWDILADNINLTRGVFFVPVKSSDLSRFRQMLERGEHHIQEENSEGHIISVGRNQVLGVFWTDGQIEIEQSITDVQLVKEIFLAEAAHTVDYFLPLTDKQKLDLAKLFHEGNIDLHTWWEIRDYGAEYYSLIGESFMALFTLAYSNIIPWQDSFVHTATIFMIPEVYRILGVEPETEEPIPTPSVPLEIWLAELIKKLLEWLKGLFK
jgi:hypothetical protein